MSGLSKSQIIIQKSPRRKIAEVVLYLWGIIGMFMCLYFAHVAAWVTSPDQNTIMVAALYTLIWIGGLVFFGFFAVNASVSAFIVRSTESES